MTDFLKMDSNKQKQEFNNAQNDTGESENSDSIEVIINSYKL